MRIAKIIGIGALGTLLFTRIPAIGQVEPPEAKYKDVLGIWEAQTEDGQYAFQFAFSLDNGELKGLFSGQMGEFRMENLKYEDGNLTFLVTLNMGGQDIPIAFFVRPAGEALTGMLSLEFGEANITGRRKK
ncbi:MAG: hypothetical protein FJY82_11285 [Candidatus Aminicenantes bacterium]|nr:hypothetical protein [Candidatus Aminicenantes bacterium]